jgi:hypothetical protein
LSFVVKDIIAQRYSDRFFPKPNVNIDRNTKALEKIANTTPEEFTFIQSNGSCLSSNVSDGVLIIQSPVMNHGQRGLVKDLNINFTTIAGTVRMVKLRGQDGLILVDIVRGITASSSGTGDVVLQEGEAIGIVGQVAGAGTFSALFTGTVRNLG